jgi:hypothetical protein
MTPIGTRNGAGLMSPRHNGGSNMTDGPAVGNVNVTLAGMSVAERAALTAAQREGLQRAERGELPVDARSPHYREAASENFVHSISPEARRLEAPVTDTVSDALLTTVTGEAGLVVSPSGDIVVDERTLGAGTEPDGEFSAAFNPSGDNAPDGEGFQSDGSPTAGPSAIVYGDESD